MSAYILYMYVCVCVCVCKIFILLKERDCIDVLVNIVSMRQMYECVSLSH